VPKWQSNAQEKTDTKSYHDNDIVIVDFTFLVLYQNSHKMRASRTPQNSPELFREREHQQSTTIDHGPTKQVDEQIDK